MNLLNRENLIDPNMMSDRGFLCKSEQIKGYLECECLVDSYIKISDLQG